MIAFAKGFFTDPEGHPDIGKVQHLLWTLASVGVWVFVCVRQAAMSDIPNGVLVAQALSSATLVGSIAGSALKRVVKP